MEYLLFGKERHSTFVKKCPATKQWQKPKQNVTHHNNAVKPTIKEHNELITAQCAISNWNGIIWKYE